MNYFLTYEAERKAIQGCATAQALCSHMAQNRLALLAQLLGIMPQVTRAV